MARRSYAALPPRNYIGSDLVGDLHRRVSGVSAARIDVDDDVVTVRQRAPAAPTGGAGVLLSRNGTQRAVSVGDLIDGPLRLALCVGVLAAGRPLLGGSVEEGSGFFHGREQHHCLLEIVREVIAVVEALILLGPVTAVGINWGLRRSVDGEALLRRHGGAVVRHRGLLIRDRHSGRPESNVDLLRAEQQASQFALDKGTRNHRSCGRRGLGIAYRAAAPGDQNADDRSRKRGRWLAHVFLPIPSVPNRSAWRDTPHSAAREENGAVSPPTPPR